MRIEIIVYQNSAALANNRRLFARSLDWDCNLQFPYDDTQRVLRCLYGSSCVISIVTIP